MFGTRAFSRYDKNYIKEATCRWRPCHESATILARVVTRRRIVMDIEPFQTFLSEGSISFTTLVTLQHNGSVDGLQHCSAWPTVTAEALGGVLIGLRDPKRYEKLQSDLDKVWMVGTLSQHKIESLSGNAESSMALALINSVIEKLRTTT